MCMCVCAVNRMSKMSLYVFMWQFLDAFQNTQMFDVFVQQRETPEMYSSIANGQYIYFYYNKQTFSRIF